MKIIRRSDPEKELEEFKKKFYIVAPIVLVVFIALFVTLLMFLDTIIVCIIGGLCAIPFAAEALRDGGSI